MRWLKHAFAIDPPGPAETSPDEQRVIQRLVREIDRRGLTAPAILFLESSRPLNYITSQFLVFIGPIARVIFDTAAYNTFTNFLMRRGSIETLCRAIEDRAAGVDPPSDSAAEPSSAPEPAHH
jgi:hypothetical protein